MLFKKASKYESRISWSYMKNKAKLGQDQNCWKLHHPTGRTCLRTSATRTAPDDLVFTISAIWWPTGEYDEGSQWHDVQASLRQKTKCWIQLLMKTLNAHTSYLSREPQVYPCKKNLASVNFYRFNAKNWHFRQILLEKVAFFFFTDLTRKIGVFWCKFYSPKILPLLKKWQISGMCKGWCLLHILLIGLMGIVQYCNIVPSLVSYSGKIWDLGLYITPQLPCGFDHFCGAGRGRAGNHPLSAGPGGHPCHGSFSIVFTLFSF